MHTHVHEIALSGPIMDIIGSILAGVFTMKVVFSLVIAALTFGILDAIMKNSMEKMEHPKMKEPDRNEFTSALLVILSVALPI